MIPVSGLTPEVKAIGTALGLLKPGTSGLALDPGFFSAPWDRVRQMLSDETQRAGLITAMEGLLPPSDPTVAGAAAAGVVRNCYPLLERGNPGQIFIFVQRANPAPSAAMQIGVLAEAQVSGDGPAVMAELILVAAEGSTLKLATATPEYPFRLEARAKVGSTGAEVSAALCVVAPPDADKTRFIVRIDGLAGGAAPIELDLTAAAPSISRIAAVLLQLGLAEMKGTVSSEVERIAEAIPTLLGLAGGVPPLPLEKLVHDSSAFRSWITTLAAATDTGHTALVAWLDALGQLLGTPALPAPAPAATEEDPVLIPLVSNGGTSLTMNVFVRTDPSTCAPVLVFGLRAEVNGIASTSPAVLRAEAVLLALPLSGTGAATVLESLDVRIDAPSTGALIDKGGPLAVGSLRAGIRYRPQATGPIIVPLLELLDVEMTIGGKTISYDVLDLTSTRTLTSAADALLSNALNTGFGSAGDKVKALRTLVGLEAGPPTIDLGLLASAPTRAFVDYYRSLRGTIDGWTPVLRSFGTLLGTATQTPITGDGTILSPWLLPLEAFGAAVAGSPAPLVLALWDAGDSTVPRLCMGLRAQLGAPAWSVGAQVSLLSIELREGGGGQTNWLGGLSLTSKLVPPEAPALFGGLAIRASHVGIDIDWAPGTRLSWHASIADLAIDTATGTVELGTLVLPPASPLNTALPDLGLGLDPTALWDASRLLLSRCASSWGGPTERAALALLGIAGPETYGLPNTFPPLSLPKGGDLGSLLRQPLEALRTWLAGVLSEETTSLTAEGVPFFLSLLDLAQLILTNRVPWPGCELTPPALPVHGAGTPGEPWAIPLHSPGTEPVEVLTWLEPEGPPTAWSNAAAGIAGDGTLDADDVISLAAQIGDACPEVAQALVGRNLEIATARLRMLATLLTDSDGLLPLVSATPSVPWETGEPVYASHDQLPSTPEASDQIRAWLDSITVAADPTSWSTLLLAPPLAGPKAWKNFLMSTPLAEQATINLRVPGVPPGNVDLGGVPSAHWYTVDLADDGTEPLVDVLGWLGRIVAAVRAAKPSSRVIIVAHSYLGLVAQAYASAHPDEMLGLVVLGSPVAQADLINVDDPEIAEAIWLASALAPRGFDGTPTGSALTFLTGLVEGYRDDGLGLPPQSARLPLAAFHRGAVSSSVDLHGCPALAIAGLLDDDVRVNLAYGLVQAVSVNSARENPTHLAWGVRTGLGLPKAAQGDPDVDVTVRLPWGILPLSFDSSASVALPQSLEVRMHLAMPEGWLLLQRNASGAVETRVRSMDWIFTLNAVGGVLQTGLDVRLHEVALRGSAATQVGLDDPRCPELLDAVIRSLDKTAVAGGRLAALLDCLSSLGVVRRASGTVTAGVATDGLLAIATGGVAVLGPLVAAMLDRPAGLFGLSRAAGTVIGGGPWRYQLDPLPFELVVEKTPWRITVQTTSAGLSIGPGSTLATRGVLALADLTTEVTGSVSIAGIVVGKANPGDPITLTAPFLSAPVALAPGDPKDLEAVLVAELPGFLLGAVLTVLLEDRFRGVMTAGPILGLLRDPAGWLASESSLGDGTLPKADKLRSLLAALAMPAGLATSADKPLVLPGGLILDAADLANGILQLSVRTNGAVPLWKVDSKSASLDLGVQVAIDRQRHATPGGSATLHIPLPGGWGGIDLRVAADASGLSLGISTDTGLHLQLLPTVSGLDTLIGAVSGQLFPAVLDQLDTNLDARIPRPATLDDALAVAKGFGIYDDSQPRGQRFKSKAPALITLISDLQAGNFQTEAVAISGAVNTLLGRILGPGLIFASAAPGTIAVQVGNVAGGSLIVAADFANKPPGIRVKAQGLTLGPVTADGEAGYVSGALLATVDLKTAFDTKLGVVLTPRLSAGLTTVGTTIFAIAFRPLGNDDVIVSLAPIPAPPSLDDLAKLARTWVIPFAGALLLRTIDKKGILDYPLWTNSTKTIGDLILSMKIADLNSGVWSLADPLPDQHALLKGLLDGLTDIPINLPGDFTLQAVKDGTRYGLVLRGEQSFALGDYAMTLFFGLPAGLDPEWGDAGHGVGLFLLDLTTPSSPKVAPVIRLGGFGIGIERNDKMPIISVDGFQLGAGKIYVSTDIALTGTNAPSVGTAFVAAELDKLGMFIASGDNSNPVAASMLQSGGSGDSAPANPPFDLMVASSPANPKFKILFSGQSALRFEVNKTFGPLHIEEIELLYKAANAGPGLGSIGIGIDGGISVSGLSLETDDLSLLVPLEHPAELNRWTVDLAGLALSFQSSSVSLSGGLRKALLTLANGTQVVDYEGALVVQVSGRGLSAVGAYSQVKDTQYGQYASFFAFLAINMPLGGPPYLYVTGLAGGVGYNRRLLTPRDPSAVGSFPLVSAMTGSCTDPMQQLKEIGADIPPSHGAFWLAAGVRFTTFALLRTTALVTVSVDHGFEVSLLGLMQLQLPPAQPIASLELALSAKYSTVDQVLSLQAALTQNSWLISRDCQLTGGFAFIIWFQGPSYPLTAGSPEVLLSIGGYSKYFAPVPNYYPVVPRVGFHWNVGGGIVVKGESFFTLTQSAIMFGGALEASYDVDPIRVWFAAELDVLVIWDPFNYFADIGVEIGAQFHYDVNLLFGTVTISASITQGALVHIEGPPLHGEVTVELCIATITVPFGATKQPQHFLLWPQACLKYLEAGDPAQPGTSAAVALGAQAATDQRDGSEEKPWPVSCQFTVRVDSKMPASGWRFIGLTTQEHTDNFGADKVDVVPCGPNIIKAKGLLVIKIERKTGGARTPSWESVNTSLFDTKAIVGYFPVSVWDSKHVPQTNPNTGKPLQNSDHPDMLKALGSLELSAGATASGMLPTDIPFASLIEDDLPLLPLNFGPAAGNGALVVDRSLARKKKTVKPVVVVKPRIPELRMVLGAPFKLTGETLAVKGLQKGKKGVKASSAHLPRGGAHVWLVDPLHRHNVDIIDKLSGVRVTALNGTGGVLLDGVAAKRAAYAPIGTCRLLVTEHSLDDFAGWELDTPLLYAGSATALAPGAIVLTSSQWTPPSRFGRPGTICWVPAVALSAHMDNITTQFTIAKGSAPTVVIVRLDRYSKGARTAEVVVEIDGKRMTAVQIVQSGARVDMIFPVQNVKPNADSLCVKVTAGEHWRLAGVVGTRGGAARWTSRLTGQPHTRLIRPGALSVQGHTAVNRRFSKAAPIVRTRVTVSAVELKAKTRKRKAR